MRICIIGTGYVGLVTGACLAELGHDVICVDKNREKIGKLVQGVVPIYEPGLEQLISLNMKSGRLNFTPDIGSAADRGADFYFIAVGTPSRIENGGADVSQVHEAAIEAAQAIQSRRRKGEGNFAVFVIKSTVPVGTGRGVAKIISKYLHPEEFAVASNPEFLREGSAIQDFMSPDRIVAGSQSERARALLEELYRPLTRQGCPLVMTTAVETAELIKYAANAFLATKISFINELSHLCELTGADIVEIGLGMGLDKRIGDKFLNAGPGYGGSCLPKDTLALIKIAKDFHCRLEIVESVVRVNKMHRNFIIDKIRDALGGTVSGKRIAVLGLAFKANTDDIRESPALAIIPILTRDGAHVTAYDPVASENSKSILSNESVRFAVSLSNAIKDADAAIILTEWDEFRLANWLELAKLMSHGLIIDFRNLFTLSQARAFEIDYLSLGRDQVLLQPLEQDIFHAHTRDGRRRFSGFAPLQKTDSSRP